MGFAPWAWLKSVARGSETEETSLPARLPVTKAAGGELDSLTALLASVEKTALMIYEAYGLPTDAGHYSRSPRAKNWRHIGTNMSAEERWTLALKKPDWRFSTREALGGQTDAPPELRQAAHLLAVCTELQQMSFGGMALTREAISLAVNLGAEWTLLQLPLSQRQDSPLKFFPTSENQSRSGQPSRRLNRRAIPTAPSTTG